MKAKNPIRLSTFLLGTLLLGALIVSACGAGPTTSGTEGTQEQATAPPEQATAGPSPTPTEGVAQSFEIPAPAEPVGIQATGGDTESISGWLGEYYDNPDLEGEPALVRDDSSISFDWETGAPGEGLPSDQFSVRWTRTHSFEEGTYRFFARCDDGAVLWLDGERIIDEWHLAGGATYSADYELDAGPHLLRLEYYEAGGSARIHLWWEQLDPALDPYWTGTYFGNETLEGRPILERDDSAIDFVWDTAAPHANLPADHFSVRWTRSVRFDAAAYRFHAVVDDGVRMWIDDELLIDEWQDGAVRERTADLLVTRGAHDLRVEFYERSGRAQVQVWWEEIGSYYVDWMGEYWSNRNLNGEPVLTQNEMAVDFDWGEGSPAGGMPVEHFSARWTRSLQFEAGTYRFYIVVDDGARLWVDDRLILDDWQVGGARQLSADLTMAAGEHTVHAEYYENGGLARMHLWWERIGDAHNPVWHGRYWANMELRGNPSLERTDQEIDFDWGTAPAATGLPADRFSARWERWVTFAAGTYTFYAQADNGIRFYLDDELLIDEWYTNSEQVHQYVRQLSGAHYLVVEYYDNAGAAMARLWWQARQ